MEALAHITTPEFAVAFVVSFIAAAVQSTVGFGFALLSVPLLSLLNPLFAPVPQLIVVFPLTLAIVLRERHAVEFRSTLWIFAGRIPGALVGVALLKLLSTAALDVLMSLMVITGVAIVVSRGTFRRTSAREFFAGVASGTPFAPTSDWCLRSAYASRSACVQEPGRSAGKRSSSAPLYCQRSASGSALAAT